MVDEECRRYKPTKNYLEHLTPIGTQNFETELMRSEFQRIEGGMRMETMNTKRYELPGPPAGKLSEIQAWQESVDNSFAQLEHQSIRLLNLELLEKYGCEAWKASLENLVGLNAKAQKELAELKKQIQDVNWSRKNKQMQTGEQLNRLNDRWVNLVSCNFDLESAIKQLEQQIYSVKAMQKKDDEIKDEEDVKANGDNENNAVNDEDQEME
jgi:pre-mRNA-splicing factor SPF27